jgi:hypothetical protein
VSGELKKLLPASRKFVSNGYNIGQELQLKIKRTKNSQLLCGGVVLCGYFHGLKNGGRKVLFTTTHGIATKLSAFFIFHFLSLTVSHIWIVTLSLVYIADYLPSVSVTCRVVRTPASRLQFYYLELPSLNL